MRNFKLFSGICLIFIFATVSYILFNVNKALRYYPVIKQYSQQCNVDPLFITSIIKVESNFNPDARSKKGAIGLMQIMPPTAKEIAGKYFGVTDFNEQQLASYNAGLGNVQKWQQENPIIEYDSEEMPFKETKHYVSKISKIYGILKSICKRSKNENE